MSRLIRVLGLAFAASLLFGALSVASASAAPEWELNGTKVTEWMSVDSTATLELEDSKVPLIGATKVSCTGTDTGDVGPGGLDKVLSITVSSCKPVSGGCEAPVTASAVHLPWNTDLVEVENSKKEKEVRDKILNSGAGQPGWKVNCESIIGAQEDICEQESGTESTVGIDNVTKGAHKGDVAALFDATSREKPAKCSKGGAKSGFVYGTEFILASNGATLTASKAKEVEL